jgi:hypothetical protein
MLLHEKRMEMQAELSSASSSAPKYQKECKESEVFSAGSAKLPKLVIAKFGGSFTDWPKFWGQFSEVIDKSLLAPITKFTYLLELLEPNIKRGVESLPFSPEGYNRAKVILKDKYGKEYSVWIYQPLREPIPVRLLTFVINLRIQFKRSRRWAKLVMLMGTYQ